jgi:hypothetical protein
LFGGHRTDGTAVRLEMQVGNPKLPIRVDQQALLRVAVDEQGI